MPLTIRPDKTAPGQFARAADTIREGGIVVFPTETVYGIGADTRCPRAIERAAKLKRNPAGKPLLVHCATGGQLAGLTADLSGSARRLAAGRADIVAYLQAFDRGVPQGLALEAYIRRQIRAARDAGGAGWALWHPGSDYGPAFQALAGSTDASPPAARPSP